MRCKITFIPHQPLSLLMGLQSFMTNWMLLITVFKAGCLSIFVLCAFQRKLVQKCFHVRNLAFSQFICSYHQAGN